MQYTSLDKVPLPEIIYNGPLDKGIVPLVKAVISHGLTTTGSCEGHIDTGDQSPWVQFMPYDNSRLVEFLIDRYNERNCVHWRMDGNSVRTKEEARNLSHLSILHDSIYGFSQFLFQYRPEVLDPDYGKGIIRIPDIHDPEYIRISSTIDSLYDELIEINRLSMGKYLDESTRKEMRKKIDRIKELSEMEARMGDVVNLPVTEQKLKGWMKKAERLIG